MNRLAKTHKRWLAATHPPTMTREALFTSLSKRPLVGHAIRDFSTRDYVNSLIMGATGFALLYLGVEAFLTIIAR